MTVSPGSRLGSYEIEERIGVGGMATVFRAYQPAMNRHVAIKVLPEHFLQLDHTFLTRFRQEAELIAGLEHPRILPVFDFSEEDEVPFIAMRLMSQGSLKDRMRRGLLPVPDVLRVVEQVAEALDFAHKQGVVHRDLKPANILLDEEGNAFLSDFGIAKVIEASQKLTHSGAIGTPPYMAPEQIWSKQPSPQTDIYALAVVTFELLTGRPPFEAPDALAVLQKHLTGTVPALTQYRSDLPEKYDFQPAIERAMAKAAEDRYRTASEFSRDLIASSKPTGKRDSREPSSRFTSVTRLLKNLTGILTPDEHAPSDHPLAATGQQPLPRRRVVFAAFAAALILVPLTAWLILRQAPNGPDGTGALPAGSKPSITITRLPPRGAGGERMETIAGHVHASDPTSFKVVIFAWTDRWWVQPFSTDPYTEVSPDGTWSAHVHLGDEYVALLVKPAYRPPATAWKLPRIGEEVVAIARAGAGEHEADRSL